MDLIGFALGCIDVQIDSQWLLHQHDYHSEMLRERIKRTDWREFKGGRI